MNWLKKGPDLKLSELHIPDFVYDVYYDLKERHLLPLVAVLLVAIVAVPIYVKSSTRSSPEPAPHRAPAATASAASPTGETLVVARSTPGLRDYHRRLSRARALDPFEEKGGEPSSSAESSGGEAAAAGEVAPSPAATVPTEATVIGEEPTTPPAETPIPAEAPSITSEPSSGGSGGETRTRYASNAIDVRIISVPAGSANNTGKPPKPTAQVRHNLPELTMLPARATPAATFMGTSRDGKKALLLVSSDVVSIFGEANCLIGSQSCQLIALEPGLPETFVYGPQERTYRIELLKINRTLSAKPRRAALGDTKSKHTPKQHQSTGSEPAGRGGEENSAAG
jgi:hypothetical protein